MNYYEHHIRDYDAATAHLSWDQDLAYTRLLRWYYRKEQPIPADVKEACRQIRATSKQQREAVEAVLREFFVLQEDGWHKDDCDTIIAKFQAGEPEREAKKINEDTRLSRHRAERAELFRIINAAGYHRPWNYPIAELREFARSLQEAEPATGTSNTSNAPATQPATATATPATATQYPIPTPHYPLPIPHDVAVNTSEASPLHPTAAAPPAGKLNGHHPQLEGIPPAEEPPTEPPPCPHQQLIALYAKHLGHLRQPRGDWDGARAEAMRTRWRECAKPSDFSKGYTTVEGGLAFWDKFFHYVAGTDLASGFPRDNGKRWLPDLPWLVTKENFKKVIEGSYAE